MDEQIAIRIYHKSKESIAKEIKNWAQWNKIMMMMAKYFMFKSIEKLIK